MMLCAAAALSVPRRPDQSALQQHVPPPKHSFSAKATHCTAENSPLGGGFSDMVAASQLAGAECCEGLTQCAEPRPVGYPGYGMPGKENVVICRTKCFMRLETETPTLVKEELGNGFIGSRESLTSSGEAMCEGHGYNKTECASVGCCQFAECSDGSGGECHSNVGGGACVLTADPAAWHTENGPWCNSSAGRTPAPLGNFHPARNHTKKLLDLAKTIKRLYPDNEAVQTAAAAVISDYDKNFGRYVSFKYARFIKNLAGFLLSAKSLARADLEITSNDDDMDNVELVGADQPPLEETATGSMVHEGDMIAASDNQLKAFSNHSHAALLYGKSKHNVAYGGNMWSDKTLKYCIDPAAGPEVKEVVDMSIVQFTAAVPCISMIDVGVAASGDKCNESPAVWVTQASSGCYSYVGMMHWWERQDLNLGPGCTTLGITMHEFLHAFGQLHEQSRSDRDDYIDIYLDNVNEDYKSQYENDPNGDISRPYDILSIMHYHDSAFSSNGQKTMTVKKEGYARYTDDPNEYSFYALGNRIGMTQMDADQLADMYSCEASTYRETECTDILDADGKVDGGDDYYGNALGAKTCDQWYSEYLHWGGCGYFSECCICDGGLRLNQWNPPGEDPSDTNPSASTLDSPPPPAAPESASEPYDCAPGTCAIADPSGTRNWLDGVSEGVTLEECKQQCDDRADCDTMSFKEKNGVNKKCRLESCDGCDVSTLTRKDSIADGWTCCFKTPVPTPADDDDDDDDDDDEDEDESPPVEKKCKGWCDSHSDLWGTKCIWDKCGGCDECTSPSAPPVPSPPPPNAPPSAPSPLAPSPLIPPEMPTGYDVCHSMTNRESDTCCRSWEGRGYCEETSTYFEYVTGNCAAACYGCPADQYSNCPELMEYYGCDGEVYSYDSYGAYEIVTIGSVCPVTCRGLLRHELGHNQRAAAFAAVQQRRLDGLQFLA